MREVLPQSFGVSGHALLPIQAVGMEASIEVRIGEQPGILVFDADVEGEAAKVVDPPAVLWLIRVAPVPRSTLDTQTALEFLERDAPEILFEDCTYPVVSGLIVGYRLLGRSAACDDQAERTDENSVHSLSRKEGKGESLRT